MRAYREDSIDPPAAPACSPPEVIVAEVVDRPGPPQPAALPPRPRVVLPLCLFLATCASTMFCGFGWYRMPEGPVSGITVLLGLLQAGATYAVPVMLILVFHEAGHYIQARRYGVQASLPYFIPMPFSPIGTLGAVIAMDAQVRDRRALFDIGITGPLAGLVPTMVFLVWGLHLSEYGVPRPGSLLFGDPLIFRFFAEWIRGPAPPGHEVMVHPFGFAAWVGLLITSLNLLPVGQLDGGHVLYALLRNRAATVASVILAGVTAAVIYGTIRHGYPQWLLMLFLLFLMGPAHPPTGNDHARLGPVRVVLGWLTLAFIFVGLTPTPIILPSG